MAIRTAVPTAQLAAAGLALIAVCYGLARFAYGLFVPVLRAEFGLDAAVAGAIAASSYVGYCVAIVAAAILTGRWGARPTAVAAGVTAAVGTGLIAAAPTTPVLAVGVVIAGSSTGLASPPLADAVARWITADRRDRVQTVVNAGTGLGVMVSGPVALLVDENWRMAWWIFALAAAVATGWIAITIPGRQRRGGDSEGAALPSPLLPRAAVRLLAAAAAMGLASSAVWTFGRDIAVTTGGIGPRASTAMWIVLGAAGLLGALTGDAARRVGLPAVWSAGILGLAAATTCFALAPGSLPVLFVAAALFGAVYIALTGLLLLWGTYAYPGAPAFGVGAAFLMLAVGQAVGAPVVGLLSDVTSPPSAFLVAAATAVAGLALRPSPGARAPDRGRAVPCPTGR